MSLYKLLSPAIFKIDAECAHSMTIKALKTGAACPFSKPVNSPALTQKLFGLTFNNPIGIAAGFDKNAEVIAPMLKMGFGLTEVGTVTLKPQDGNPKPRIFRDPKNKAVINRMGFPSGGLSIFKDNLAKHNNCRHKPDGVVGINIGMNKEQTDAALDYCALIEELAPMADYLTVNISSPNTPGLRDLQQKDVLSALITKMMESRDKVCADKKPAIFIKLAPDLTDEQQEELAATLMDSKVDGVILTNTTLDRPDYLPSGFASEKGGLSGEPVRSKSTKVISNFYKLTYGKLPIIGVGGVSTAEHAYEKIKAGASLVQLYSGLIYEGPKIANNINKGMIELIQKDGYKNISEAIGSDHK